MDAVMMVTKAMRWMGVRRCDTCYDGLVWAMVLAGVLVYLDFTNAWYLLSGNERGRWIGEAAITEKFKSQ
jgi:hypothetical protein